MNEIGKGNVLAANDQQLYLEGYLGVYYSFMSIISNTNVAVNPKTGPFVIDSAAAAQKRLCTTKGLVNVHCPCEDRAGASNNTDLCYLCSPGTYGVGNKTSQCSPCPVQNSCPSYGTLLSTMVPCTLATSPGVAICPEGVNDCRRYIPGREGGFFIFEDFDTATDLSLSGACFTLAILIFFLAEIFVALLQQVRNYRKKRRRISQRSSSKCSQTTATLPKLSATASISSFLSRKRSMATAIQLAELSYRPSDQALLIEPTLENLYPIFAIFTDFLQFLSIVLSPNIDWLQGTSSTDYISFIAISFDWFFWVMVGLVLPWTLYLVFLLTRLEYKLSSSFIGRIILFPSDYLVPLGSSVLFIPALTNFLDSLVCVATREPHPDVVSPLVLNEDCDMECWSSTHWIYATFGGVLLLVYWPLAHYASPLWQSIQGENLQVRYRPLFFYIDTLLKTALVFSRALLRQYIAAFYAIVMLCFGLYWYIFLFHSPCKVPWAGNLRALFYTNLIIIAVIVISSLETTSSDDKWPYVAIVFVFGASVIAYAVVDVKKYPTKIIDKNDKTRDLIRQFVTTNSKDSELDSVSHMSVGALGKTRILSCLLVLITQEIRSCLYSRGTLTGPILRILFWG